MPSKKQEQLDEKDRRLLIAVALGLSFDIRIFSQRLGQEIERLTRGGLNEQSIIGVLNQDFSTNGRILANYETPLNEELSEELIKHSAELEKWGRA